MFVSADGDDIGSQVSAAILSGNEKTAHKLSLLINLGGKAIYNYAKKVWAAKSVISGGDDIMVRVDAKQFVPDDVEVMRSVYAKTVKGATLSVGVGSTPVEAMKALVVAKNTGKDKAVFWDESKQSIYIKAVKSRIEDLREKLRAQGGLTEAYEDIHKLAPFAVKKSIRNQERRAGRKPSSRSSGNVKRRDLGPHVPEALKDRQQHVNLMRSLVKHYTHQAANYKNRADRDRNAGDLKSSWQNRRDSRLFSTTNTAMPFFKDRAVLHTAAHLRDTKSLPASIRGKVQLVRDSMARKIKDARGRGEIVGTRLTAAKERRALRAKADPWARNPTRASFHAHIKFADALRRVRRGHSLIPNLKVKHPSPKSSTETGKPLGSDKEVNLPKKKRVGLPPRNPKKLPGGGYLVLKPQDIKNYLRQHHRPW